MARQSLQGKVVIITGASSGIGRALAHELSKEGASLTLAARRVAKLESLAREIMETYQLPALVMPTDIRRTEDIKSMIQKTYDHYGRIDVLINNAGILAMAPFAVMPVKEMEDLMNTNFWPIVHSVRAIGPIMSRKGVGGHVINVGSVLSRRGVPYMAGYCASKFALAGLTESLRVELAQHNILFTTVYPGGVETEMPHGVDRKRLPDSYPNHAGMRISAERVARAIVKAIHTRPPEVYVPWWTRFVALISVICPSFADFLTRRSYNLKK